MGRNRRNKTNKRDKYRIHGKNRRKISILKYKIYKKKENVLNKKIKKIRKDAIERKWYEEKEELKKHYVKGNIKKIWDFLKRIKNKENKKSFEHQPLQNKDGTKTKGTMENLDRWREWMKDNF